MTRLRESGDGPKRGRGRPRKEPPRPAGWSYEAWRAVHAPALKHLLEELEAGAEQWETYLDHWKTYELAYDAGQGPKPPPPPSDAAWLWGLLRETAHWPADRRADLVATMKARRRPMPAPVVLRDHHGREHALPMSIGMHDLVAWIRGETLAHGIAAGLATPYQAWLVIAERLLAAADIGAIVRDVNPGRFGRKTGVSAAEARALDAALVRDERKRVNARRTAFGYDAD